jgi:hypothetical protein
VTRGASGDRRRPPEIRRRRYRRPSAAITSCGRFFWLLAVLAVLVLVIVDAHCRATSWRRRAQALLVAQLAEVTAAGPWRPQAGAACR